MRIIGVIPARYGSTRFPGKPLSMIHGKPMIQLVYEQAKKSTALQDVIVATDDDRIMSTVESFGGKVMLTSTDHQTGTDRCREVLENLESTTDAIINIQGDEPFIDPEQIDQLASCLAEEETEIATLIKKINKTEDLFNPNKPKVIIDQDGKAIYFSRSPIPFFRGVPEDEWISSHNYYKHIGIYGYRSAALKSITKMNQSPLELAESLEQLRWLENGLTINTAITETEAFSVDTPEDLDFLLKNIAT